VGAPSKGSVVLVPFPFSDLSQAKYRPAVVLAAAGKGDWVLCQVTSNAYGDEKAIRIGGAILFERNRGGCDQLSNTYAPLV
jgi:mRNA interferase MazF